MKCMGIMQGYISQTKLIARRTPSELKRTPSRQTIEGRERYPINVHYPRKLRDSVQKLRGRNLKSAVEEMQCIAAPMVGGMVSAPLLSMLIIPTLYNLLCCHGGWRQRT